MIFDPRGEMDSLDRDSRPMKTQIAIFALFALVQVCRAQDDSLSLDIHIAEEPSFYSQGIRNALTSIHGKNDFVYGYLKDDCKLSDEEAVAALKCLVDELAVTDSPEDRSNRFQAICCIRDYPCDEAYAFLKRLLADMNEPERRTAAYSLTRMSLGDSARLARLEEIADTIPTENWARQEVYQTIATHLQYAGPSSSNQLSLVRFLLNRTIVDAQLFDMLDEILCREVPKWRASPQRAENAAKMIREHPDDARLVSFFETVRTNALESARTALPPERADADSPATTNQMTRASAPPSDSDPWAGLLDDLPGKKPWTPPPGAEPPF